MFRACVASGYLQVYVHAVLASRVEPRGADSWDLYLKGIFDYCGKDAIIDHAVTLIGYGKDAELKNVHRPKTRATPKGLNEMSACLEDAELGKKYWRILNSWGKNFGEDGTIRILRNDQEDSAVGRRRTARNTHRMI